MDIDKAIEMLTLYIKRPEVPNCFDQDGAIQLGIEALKRINNHRHAIIDMFTELLPGETERTDNER